MGNGIRELVRAEGRVLAFLLLLLLVRGPFYVLALTVLPADGPDVSLWAVAFAMLSSPPVLAVAVKLYSDGNLRGMGWRLGRLRYLVLGWAGPLVVTLPVYGVLWALGGVEPVPVRVHSSIVGATLVSTLALTIPTLLFEELAWRGFLVPELAKRHSFLRVALVSGVVWALFHYPFLLSPQYAERPPSVVGVIAFTGAIVAGAFPLAWLRLRSGSIWPAVLFHAGHNAFVNQVLSRELRVTSERWEVWTEETGLGLMLAYGVLAVWTWYRSR